MTAETTQKVYDLLPKEDFPLVETCVVLRHCPQCKKKYNIKLSVHDYITWSNGANIQNSFSYLDNSQREMIVTGIHPECWEKFLGPEDED